MMADKVSSSVAANLFETLEENQYYEFEYRTGIIKENNILRIAGFVSDKQIKEHCHDKNMIHSFVVSPVSHQKVFILWTEKVVSCKKKII